MLEKAVPVKTCGLHKFTKAIFTRLNMVSPDEDEVLMCDKCRDKLIEMFGEECFDSLKVERI